MVLLPLFLDNLLPIFLTAGAGWLLAVTLKTESRSLSHVAFNLFLPCLTYRIVVENHVPADAVLRMIGFTLANLAGVALVAWAIARAFRWGRPRTSAFVLCAMIPNTGNFGLSANLLAFGPSGATYAGIFYLASTVMTATVGVGVASLGRAGIGRALQGLLKVPVLWAVVVALAMRWLGLALPGPIDRAVRLCADGCIPLLLVILGMQLGAGATRASAGPLALSTGLRLAGGAALGLALAPAFGLSGPARQAGVFQAAAPTAIITTILATEYDVEPDLVTATVFATTLLSPLTLTPLLAALR
jgi:predicted permease